MAQSQRQMTPKRLIRPVAVSHLPSHRPPYRPPKFCDGSQIPTCQSWSRRKCWRSQFQKEKNWKPIARAVLRRSYWHSFGVSQEGILEKESLSWNVIECFSFCATLRHFTTLCCVHRKAVMTRHPLFKTSLKCAALLYPNCRFAALCIKKPSKRAPLKIGLLIIGLMNDKASATGMQTS